MVEVLWVEGVTQGQSKKQNINLIFHIIRSQYQKLNVMMSHWAQSTLMLMHTYRII